jgi:arylsulfatase A-like enzyme
VDIAPTFAQIAGVKPSEEIDGHPLVAAILKN